MSRRESVGRVGTASQSDSSEPAMRMVTVAVLPPRLPSGMAPPTGLGPADIFSWNEAVNWQHNDDVKQEDPGRRKSFMRKVGLTTQKKRAGEEDDLPPFVMRQVPYDIWRKHYAKDKDGNYWGTHAPAEDCLLKPENVQKWRLDDPTAKGDKWTRGQHALPVYAEAQAEGPAPDYQIDAKDHPQSVGSTTVEACDGRNTMQSTRQTPFTSTSANNTSLPLANTTQPAKKTIADNKTAAEIIADAEAKPKQKMTWKEKFSEGATMAMLGGSS
ncbi:uncharacterized protein A1O9_06580 [Exophiala aquamarina CBS 119918]|uniref:Uncharacterized protein n=1 Tax=Exophiala aquamarina CBS 119918 TaxID=1182545 RepID=A0A072PEU4_9EURO|nr:uncharacterized protein A1O9_06580 [Exophiala aquamarina CBS 119918]KEF58654.1 hypothetical protein A1O9_06580 [Exophiala aquamarina CBS 119918]